eukprot:gene21134-23988_t
MATDAHELVGVGFLNIDRLEFLLDLEETITIVGFSGFPVGNLKLSARCWVDEIQPIPTQIITHVEANIQNFMKEEHALIVNFYFEEVSGLPENHCTDTYISFKFMGHLPLYTTPQYLGTDTQPRIDSTVQITKPITASLLDFIRTACMEFKVFAIKSRDDGHVNDDLHSAAGSVHSHQSFSQAKRSDSWKSTGSAGGNSVGSRNSMFKGDKQALERKLSQTITLTECLSAEKGLLEERLHEMEAEQARLHYENEILRNDLQSARAEIDNMYNISRGDGLTIVGQNEPSTMMPSMSHMASFQSPRSKQSTAQSKVCTIQ